MATPQLLTSKPAMLGSSTCKRAKSTDCSMLFDTAQRSTSLLPMGKKPTMVNRAASIAPGEVIGKTPTPWGVSLRRRSTVTDADKPKRRGVSGSNSFIRKRRSTLRATPVEKKSLPKKTSSRKFKLKTTPFEMGNAPIFGIVLKSVKDSAKKQLDGKGDEHMDLEFKGSSRKGDTKPGAEGEGEEAHMGPPFGVRLKPVRRGVLDGKINKGHTYQIDLKPPTSKGGSLASKYIPESKSFLEIRLKPVTAKQKSQRNLSRQESHRPEFVELQLRHVVAPVDGGPKRAVTQASFMIPVASLKHIDLDALRQQRNLKNTACPNKLAELLQIQIESLNHREDPMKFKGKGQQGPQLNTHALRINLRHVDPNTGKTTWLPQSIDVQLKDQEYETTQLKSASSRRSSMMNLPPSMQVSLRPVLKNSLNSGSNHGGETSDVDEDDEVAKKHGINRQNKIRLKSAVQVVHEEEEEVEEWDEEELLSDDEYTEEECSEYDEQSVNSEDKRKLASAASSKDGTEESQPSYFQYEEIIEDTLPRKPGGVNLTPSSKRTSLPEMNLSRGRSSIADSIPKEIVTEFELEEQELEEDNKKEQGDEYDEEEVPEDEYDEHVLEDEYEEHELQDKPKDEYEEHVLEEDEYEEHEIAEDKENAPTTTKDSSVPQEEDEECSPPEGKSLSDEKEDVLATDSESEEDGLSQTSVHTPEPAAEDRQEEELSGGSGHEITARVIFRADTRPIDTTPPPKRRVPRRTRSRSLTEIDRIRIRQEKRREAYIKRKEQEAEEAAKRELSMDKRRDLLMWYNRMKCPNKNEMKRRVAKLPEDCDITPDDVELLPWLMKGRFLDLKVMNQFFMEDWQGKEQVQN